MKKKMNNGVRDSCVNFATYFVVLILISFGVHFLQTLSESLPWQSVHDYTNKIKYKELVIVRLTYGIMLTRRTVKWLHSKSQFIWMDEATESAPYGRIALVN